MRTSVQNGQFHLSQQKADIYSLKLTRLIPTPVNKHSAHFSVSRVILSYIINLALWTLVIGTVS